MEEMLFDFFLFLALATILCCGAKLLSDFGRRPPRSRNNPSFVEIHQVVMEKLLFEVFLFFFSFLILALVAILCSGEEHFGRKLS